MLFPSTCLLFYAAALSRAAQLPLRTPENSPFSHDFDKLVTNTLNHWKTPGLAIAVVDGNHTFSKGYGIATYPDEEVTPSTLFFTGSTTKSFTAAVVSLLIDDTANVSNPLDWQTPLSSVIREDFVLPDKWATAHVTLEDAASHRTGMPRHDLSYRGNQTIGDSVRKLRHLPMTAEPRTRWQYCNMMYIALSHFVETFTGKWLGYVFRSRIWEPLGMFDTFFSLPDYEAAQPTGKASLARGYSWVNRTQEYYRLASFDAPVLSGAGLVISNVLDYAKWLRCMISEALPLSPAGHNALRWPRINNPPIGGEETGFRGPDGYSLGWLISNYRGETMIWHNGAVPGFATVMLYLPRLQWGLVMMANSMEGGSVAEVILVYRLIDNLLDVPDQERFDWGASEESDIEKHLKMLKNPKEALYPNAPSKENAIPLTLPLQEYTGTYKHAAYPNITITLRPGSRSSLYQESSEPQHILHISTQDEQYPLYIDFMHVSGEYFVIYIRHFEEGDPKYYEPWRDSVSKAEFRLDESGKAKELGLLIEEKMGDDKIWYRKVT